MGIEIAGPGFPAPGQCQRKSPRTRELAAALLASSNQHTAPLDCVIRNINPAGAQVRVSRDASIPEPGYLINLKSGSAWGIQTLWRRGSLTGLSLLWEFAIDSALPPHMEFLLRLHREGKKRQAVRLNLDPLRFK
jgi:hypothetical protein